MATQTAQLFQGSSNLSEGITLNISKKLLAQFPLEVADIIANFKKTKNRRTFEYFEKTESDRYCCDEGEQLIIYKGLNGTTERKEVVASHSVGSLCEQYLIGQYIEVKAGDMLLVRSLFMGKWYLKVYVYFAEECYS